jgi:hypothetical protein
MARWRTPTLELRKGRFFPLLSNVALKALDEHIARAQEDLEPARINGPSDVAAICPYRFVRYVDDWRLAVWGARADAEALQQEIAGVS